MQGNPLPTAVTDAPPGHTAGRVGVVDIGSNTVRLVVYDRPERLPVPIFNEKSACRLARGLAATGRLNPEGVELAIRSLERFTRLAQAMGVERLEMVATAAVREASDGPAFVERVTKEFGFAVNVLSGEEEARLAAVGVTLGMPDADGVLADLGGGSLEVVGLDDGDFRASASLPLGHLRLAEASGGDAGAARDIVARHLDGEPWLAEVAGRTFYGTGGSWRALARVFIDQTDYPLHVVDGFTIEAEGALQLARVVSDLGPESLRRIRGIGRGRGDTLAMAALVLAVLLERLAPRQVVFSGFGMREGRLMEMLSPPLRLQDPLIAGVTGMAERTGRFPVGAGEIMSWMGPVFPRAADAGDDDDAAEYRLRMAATLLSDIGWSEHPDYRADHAFLRALRLPFAGLSHRDRVFVALAIYVRYDGDAEGDNPLVTPVMGLLDETDIAHATVTGLALRLAHTLSGSAPGLLGRTRLTAAAGRLVLRVPDDGRMFRSETVERRLGRLARALGLGSRVEPMAAGSPGS